MKVEFRIRRLGLFKGLKEPVREFYLSYLIFFLILFCTSVFPLQRLALFLRALNRHVYDTIALCFSKVNFLFMT